jgi:prepilin-type N-terminal cleavage/methylation domain-containing protein
MQVSRQAPMQARLSQRAFTLVEMVITLTIVVVLAAGSVPLFRGWQQERAARDPVLALRRLAKESRLRAMREKRPYQIAFHNGGFVASRFTTPYLTRSELQEMSVAAQTGSFRVAKDAEQAEEQREPDSSREKGAWPAAPPSAALDDHWLEEYPLREGSRLSLQLWNELEPTAIEGDQIKLWVFQPSGMCLPLHLDLEDQGWRFELDFDALSASLTREVMTTP